MAGGKVEVRRYLDRVAGKQWITLHRDGSCVRRWMYAGQTGPARADRHWTEAREEIAKRNKKEK